MLLLMRYQPRVWHMNAVTIIIAWLLPSHTTIAACSTVAEYKAITSAAAENTVHSESNSGYSPAERDLAYLRPISMPAYVKPTISPSIYPSVRVTVAGRLLEELVKLDVTVNVEKTRLVDLKKEESFSFLGFDFQRVRTRSGKWGVLYTPRMKARTNLLYNLKEVFQRFISQPVERVIEIINPKLRGWVNYFRIGHSSRCFQYIKDWVEKKIRRHLMRARNRMGFGWDRWSRVWFYRNLGLYADYKVRPQRPESAAS